MASAVIGALRVNLGIDTAEFYKGIAAAQKSLSGMGKDMRSIGRNLSLAVTAPIVAFGANMVKTAGSFEASMNRVQAASAATTSEFAAMRQMAIDLGASTSFSASESADAMEALAKNGLNASEILGGAVEASMLLAASAGAGLSESADVATGVMANFGKSAGELKGLMDGVVGVLLESKFGFDDYRLAIGQAGGIAGQLGVTFEDFNATIAATSTSFASGSDAGTSFKQFLVSLVPQSKKAASAMKELGLEFFNADGSMKNMSQIAGELKTAFAGLTDEQVNQNMKDIFGVDAMRTGIALMQQGAEGIDQFRARIADASAEDQAAARLKGFNGEMEKLSGAFETLQIAIADSGLLAAVTDFVTQLAGWIDALAKTNPELLKWGTIIAGVGAALGPVLITLGLFVTAIGAISLPVAAVVAAVAGLVTGMVYFRDELAAAALAVDAWLKTFQEDFLLVWDQAILEIQEFGTVLTTFMTGVWAQFTAIWDTVVQKIEAMKTALVNLGTVGLEAMQKMVTGITEWIGAKLNAAFDAVTNKINAVKQGFFGLYDAVVGHSYIPDMVTEIGEWMGKLGTNMVDPAVAAANETAGAFEGVGTSMNSAFSGMGSLLADVIKGTKSLSEALSEVLGKLADSLWQSAMSSLTGAFGGGGGGGGIGGLLSGLFGGLFGFAQGGSFQVGGAGGVDSQLVAFKASPNERVSITKPGQDARGSAQVVEVRGVFVDDNGVIKARVDTMGREAAKSGAALATQQVNANFPSMLANSQMRAG